MCFSDYNIFFRRFDLKKKPNILKSNTTDLLTMTYILPDCNHFTIYKTVRKWCGDQLPVFGIPLLSTRRYF